MFPFFRILAISFALHVFLFLSLIGVSVLIPFSSPILNEAIEIEFVPESSNNTLAKTQQIVQQADPSKKLDFSNKRDARFLSEKNQRVQEETQAAVSGLTQNRNQTGKSLTVSELTKISTKTKSLPHPTRDENSQATSSSERDMEEFAQQIDRLQQNNDSSQGQASTTSDALPSDVAIGSITALNTDRLTYYSFFSRVNEAIYFRWNTRVRSALDSFDNNYLRNVIRLNRWVTQAEILLRPDGRVHKVLLMKESGILRFDLAAVNAFKDAAIFPNPPQEMIQDDGFIHLKYSFTVAIN